ncbi:MAG: Dihydroorotase [Phycisphaerae bacterium]|nr:Dihydroorotase [Phycisphaerae bacterium]
MSTLKSLSICNGHIIDPSRRIDENGDLYINNGQIVDSLLTPIRLKFEASNLIVSPGLIDLHVHLREPGQTHKEDIDSGTKAAITGGFTAVGCMPNTLPALDSAEQIEWLVQQAAQRAHCRVYPLGCITLGRKGEIPGDYAAMQSAGAIGFTDDGDGVQDEKIMRQAFEKMKSINALATQHCEFHQQPKGVMHDGRVSRDLGVPGMSHLAEEDMIERDLRLAKSVKGRYHVSHVSTAGAVNMVRQARAEGWPITTEVCPHHLLLSDEDCRGLDPNYKMHPPLRPRADIDACIAGIIDGTIEMLVTDHAPHTSAEKGRGFVEAPAGIIGLETALATFIKALITPSHISWYRLIELMSTNPARIFRIPGGTLQRGAPADITIIDPDLEWTIDVNQFFSKSRNCPFNGWPVRGKTVATIVAGQWVYLDPHYQHLLTQN